MGNTTTVADAKVAYETAKTESTTAAKAAAKLTKSAKTDEEKKAAEEATTAANALLANVATLKAAYETAIETAEVATNDAGEVTDGLTDDSRAMIADVFSNNTEVEEVYAFPDGNVFISRQYAKLYSKEINKDYLTVKRPA